MKLNEKRQVKRGKILKCAYELFSTNGYDDTRVIDVANRADIGKGTFYEYFSSKDDIIKELLKISFMDYKALCEEILAKEISVKEKIKEFLSVERALVEKNNMQVNKLVNNISIKRGSVPDFMRENLVLFWRYKFKFAKKLVDEGLKTGEFKNADSQLLTLFVVATTYGYKYYKNGGFFNAQKDFKFDGENIDEDSFIEMIFDGIGSVENKIL